MMRNDDLMATVFTIVLIITGIIGIGIEKNRSSMVEKADNTVVSSTVEESLDNHKNDSNKDLDNDSEEDGFPSGFINSPLKTNPMFKELPFNLWFYTNLM